MFHLPQYVRNASSARAIGNGAVAVCCAFVLLGAIHFGLASCGGYAWHKQAFFTVGAIVALAAVAMPSSLLPSTRAKAGLLFSLPLLFLVVEAAVAPFYPSAPPSLVAYMSTFVQALGYGPCR